MNSYVPAKLNGLVDLIWEHEAPYPGSYSVLPSGKVELIFPLSPILHIDAVRITPEDNPVNNFSCFLSGLHTKPLKMRFSRFHAFGIQMKPVAVKALFGLPLYEIRDYFVEGQMLIDPVTEMRNAIRAIPDFLEKAQWFERFLLKRIHETADLHIAIHLDRAIKKHLFDKQQGSTASFESLLGYSRTQTYRLFKEWFGISSHSYQKLLQFTGTFETLDDPRVRLIDVGLDNGYYDQAHFIRSFQDFADMTPGEYRRTPNAFRGQIFG